MYVVILSEMAKPAVSSLAELIFFPEDSCSIDVSKVFEVFHETAPQSRYLGVRGKRKIHLVNSLYYPFKYDVNWQNSQGPRR